MIIYLCIKFQSFQKISHGNHLCYVRDGWTDGTDGRTDSGDTICPPPPPQPRTHTHWKWRGHKNIGLDTTILFTKGAELTIFGQLKIPMKFSINLNLKTFRLLNCLHDFSTLYTTLPHHLVKDKLVDLINRTFIRENTQYLACNEESAFFTSDVSQFIVVSKSLWCPCLSFR